MQWLVNILNHPAPEFRDAAPAILERRRNLLQLWSQHIVPVTEAGPGDPEAGDYEDFYEQAYRLQAALGSFGAGNVWLTGGPWDRSAARNVGTGEERPAANLQDLPRYGLQASVRHFEVQQEQALLAAAYPGYETFTGNAGRKVETCGYEAGGREISDVLVSMADRGVPMAFIKVNLNKYGIYTVDTPSGLTRQEASAAVSEKLGMALLYLEGAPHMFTVQDFTAMEFEYRVFVVGQQPVTGAGCIEEHTPLENSGEAFDSAVRRDRAGNSAVEIRPDVVRTLTRFAGEIAGKLSLEVPKLTEYVLDVALDEEGRPLIVELNPLLNSGLYACRPDLITDALAGKVTGL